MIARETPARFGKYFALSYTVLLWYIVLETYSVREDNDGE
jgi:hypothetical protein